MNRSLAAAVVAAAITITSSTAFAQVTIINNGTYRGTGPQVIVNNQPAYSQRSDPDGVSEVRQIIGLFSEVLAASRAVRGDTHHPYYGYQNPYPRYYYRY